MDIPTNHGWGISISGVQQKHIPWPVLGLLQLPSRKATNIVTESRWPVEQAGLARVGRTSTYFTCLLESHEILAESR